MTEATILIAFLLEIFLSIFKQMKNSEENSETCQIFKMYNLILAPPIV